MANDNMVILLIAGGAALIGATFLLKPGGARADVGTGVRIDGTGVRIDGTGGLSPEERQEEFERQQQLALQKEAEQIAAAARARGERPKARIKLAAGHKNPNLNTQTGIRVTR